MCLVLFQCQKVLEFLILSGHRMSIGEKYPLLSIPQSLMRRQQAGIYARCCWIPAGSWKNSNDGQLCVFGLRPSDDTPDLYGVINYRNVRCWERIIITTGQDTVTCVVKYITPDMCPVYGTNKHFEILPTAPTFVSLLTFNIHKIVFELLIKCSIFF